MSTVRSIAGMDITVTSPHLQSKIDIMRRQIHSLGTLKRQTSKEERYKTYCAGKFPSHIPIRPKLWDTTPTHSSWSKRFYSDIIQRHIGLYTTYLTRPAVRCVVDYLFGDKSPNAGRNRGVTSVGCGHGYLEAMLTQHMDEVVAIDVHNCDLTMTARLSLLHPDAHGSDYIQCEYPNQTVPAHHTLFFCFPYMEDCVFVRYIQLYRGNRIVLLYNSSCNPFPDKTIPGFQQVICDVYVYSEVDPLPMIAVFERIQVVQEHS
jgi:hypothetical protein